jgi:Sulfotransferase domain
MNADATTDKAMIKDKLSTLLSGYVAVADCPAVLFSGELAELYPDAIVICTTRDPEKWYTSFGNVGKTIHVMKVLNLILLPLPTMRNFGSWLAALTKKYEVFPWICINLYLDHDFGAKSN